MPSILIAYSSTDGHTRKICDVLRRVVAEHGNAVDVLPIDAALGADLAPYDKIVIGASIRYGKHRPAVYEFIRRHRATLNDKPNAFFSVNIVARKAEKNTPETNPYLRKFLRQIDWQPRRLAVFAGRLDYPRYGFFDRQMIRLIMLLTHGPTDPTSVIEYTDWAKVEDFGRVISGMQA